LAFIFRQALHFYLHSRTAYLTAQAEKPSVVAADIAATSKSFSFRFKEINALFYGKQ
jgi:hypothetical protein